MGIPKKLSLKHFSVLNQSIISYNNWNLNLLEELEDSNLENMDQPIQTQCAHLGTMTSTPHKNQNSKSWIETLELLDPAGDLRNYKASIDLNLSSPCLKNNSLNISSTQGCAYILNNNQVAVKK